MLIPEVSITDFRKLKARKIKKLKSCNVMADGEVLFIAIIPPENGGISITDNIRTQGEYLGMRGNTVGGKTIEELKEAADALV